MHDSTKNGVMTMMTCSAICSKTINHCLEMGGEHTSKDHINLLMDCVKICQLAADFAIRGSENHMALCKLCADICRRCADQCEQLGQDDETMQNCAQICNDCAAECEKMAAM
jgi:hypothetical protein